MKYTISLTTLCLALLITTGCASKSEEVLVQQATTHLRLGQYRPAARRLKQAIRAGEGSASLYHNLGISLYHIGKLRAAIQAFEEAQNRDPLLIESAEMLARCWITLGDSAKATSILENLLPQMDKSDHPRIFNDLALAARDQQPHIAFLHLQRASKLNYSYAPTHYNLAQLLEKEYGLTESAIEHLQLFSRLTTPDDPQRLKADRQLIILKNKNSSSSSVAYKDLDENEKTHLNQLLTRADQQFNAKNWNNSYSTYLAASRMAQDLHIPIYRLAVIAYQLGESDQAAKLLLEQAIPRWPAANVNYQLMSYVRAQQKQYRQARQYGNHYLAVAGSQEAGRTAFEKWLDTLPSE